MTTARSPIPARPTTRSPASARTGVGPDAPRPGEARPGEARPGEAGAATGQDRGAASLWALAVGLVLVLFAGSLALVGSAIAARHQARTAADLAALAGAARALEGTSVACGRAHEYAAANGARLSACRLDGFDLIVTATVATRFGPAIASARAGPIT